KHSAVSGQRSVVSGQPSAVSRQPSAVSFVAQASSLWHRLWPLATLCERRCDLTQIKPMLTSFIQKLFP
ncbi:MAG: hypothetical protein F6K56_16450, partial [Moorea sp. SIO3G5]|nr:hypothetical protein [Moorena sp. SIO3G5]